MRGLIIFFLLLFVLSLLYGGATCSDGWASPSIGSSGACSHHGGVSKAPGFIIFVISIVGAIYISNLIDKISGKNKTNTSLDLSNKTETTCQKNSDSDLNNTLKVDILNSAIQNNKYHNKKVCPKCGSALRLRTAKRGKHAGKSFYGCSRYPSCKGVLDMSTYNNL